MPDEQREPTRVELRAAYEAGFEASGEGYNGEYLGPKVDYPACLDKGFAEWLSEQPASAPSEQREGGAQPKPNPETLGSTDAAQADLGSTEGGARPGDTPLNDTRTNSDRPWREDVARAFVTNRPAQPEGAGEAS